MGRGDGCLVLVVGATVMEGAAGRTFIYRRRLFLTSHLATRAPSKAGGRLCGAWDLSGQSVASQLKLQPATSNAAVSKAAVVIPTVSFSLLVF